MQKLVLTFVLCLSLLPAQVTSNSVTYNAVTDLVIRPLPPTPPMGPAGTVIKDPTYGNSILRATDTGCVTPGAAQQNSWNANSTKFFVFCAGMTLVAYDFDGANMKATRIPGSINLGAPSFSYSDPNLLYGRGQGNLSGNSIYEYNFATQTYTQVVDVSKLVPSFGGGLGSTSISANDWITIDFDGIQDTYHYCLYYNLKTKQHKVLDTHRATVDGRPVTFDGQAPGYGLHLVNIDKSGRFVVLSKGDSQTGPNLLTWDTANDTFKHIWPYGTGHNALGWGYEVSGNGLAGFYMQWFLRPLDNPEGYTRMAPDVTTGGYGYKEEHTSWNNARPDKFAPVLLALTRQSWSPNPPGPWDDEILGVSTEPNHPMVYRFGHTWALFDNTDFWDLPRGNVSGDGRYFMFTSNWRRTINNKQDVFIIKLPLNDGSAPPPSQTSTSTALTCGPNPSVGGQAVTLRATVNPASATGTVQFRDEGTSIGTATLSGGVATFSTSSLPAGTHAISAAYGGDSSYQGSASGAVSHVVSAPGKTATVTTLASNVNPSTPGQNVQFTAVVSPLAAAGTVQFLDGSAVLGSASLNGGVATYSTSSLTAGAHSIRASYSGNAAYNASTSAVLTQNVQGGGSPGTVPPPVQYSAGLIANGGFESGTQGWSGFGSPAVDSTVFAAGIYSAKVTAESSEHSIQQNVRVYSGVFYTLAAYVRTTGVASSARVVWLNSGGQEIGTTNLPAVSGNSDWTVVSGGNYSPQGAYTASIVLGAAAGSGSVWYDQVGFFAGQAPSTPPPPVNPPDPPSNPPTDSPSYSAGMVVNAGFENGNQPWQGFGTSGTIDSAVFASGSNSARIAAADAERTVHQDIRVYSGVFYTMAVSVKTAGATSAARIVWLNTFGQMLGTVPLSVASGNAEWKVISAGGYSPAGATLARIVLAAAPGSGSLWFDQTGFFAGQMPGGSNGNPSNPPAEPPVTPPSNYNAGMAANGGFEGGTQPWDGLGVDGTLDTGVFLEGSNSAKVTAASSERSIEESVEVYSGVLYKLSVFVRTAGATSVARIDWLDLSGRVLGSTELPVVAGDTSWKEISASAYSLPNARRARIVLGTAPGSGSAWFDMVSFTK